MGCVGLFYQDRGGNLDVSFLFSFFFFLSFLLFRRMEMRSLCSSVSSVDMPGSTCGVKPNVHYHIAILKLTRGPYMRRKIDGPVCLICLFVGLFVPPSLLSHAPRPFRHPIHELAVGVGVVEACHV